LFGFTYRVRKEKEGAIARKILHKAYTLSSTICFSSALCSPCTVCDIIILSFSSSVIFPLSSSVKPVKLLYQTLSFELKNKMLVKYCKN